MASHSQRVLPPMEVNRVDGGRARDDDADNKVDRLHALPLDMAKVRVGAVIKRAMEGRAAKEFGDKGLVSNVQSGEKVPEYLARIYQDKAARRRMALALLEDDTDVVVTTTITIPQSRKVV